MSIQDILISEIQIENSLFSTKEVLFEPEMDDSCLNKSFHTIGILNPVILYKDAYNSLHLVAGKKRLTYAIKNNHKYIQAVMLKDNTSISDILLFLYNEKKEIINQSVINKIQFLVFSIGMGVKDDELFFSALLGFKPYNNFYEDCHRISSLPLELKIFSHDKKLSFKYLVNLSFYPKDLLCKLIQWKDLLSFTASIFEEIASNLRDYLKAHDKTIDDVLSDREVQEIFTSNKTSPRQKLEQLRRLIHVKKSPTLCKVNEKIEYFVKELNLPKNITLSWDRALENKYVEVKFFIQKPEEWKTALDRCSQSSFESTLSSILNEL